MRWLVLLALVLVAGCQEQFMPTPNMFVGPDAHPLVPEGVDPSTLSSEIELFYITDRKPENTEDGSIRYGWKRSRSAALGRVLVTVGEDLGWDEFAAATTTHERDVSLPVRIDRIEELARLAPTPMPLIRDGDELITDPDAIKERNEKASRVVELIADRVARSPRKELLVYIHGYRNTFEDAAMVFAGLHHFSRSFVPVLYTWPAGAPGSIKGYTRDRESGEFTVLHLKRTIEGLSQVPGVEKVHLIAHSRGTDVLFTALRELLIRETAAGRVARESFKLGNVVLASPDLDVDVVIQRIAGEPFENLAERLTVYVSPDDSAIGLAGWLQQSSTRLGRIDLKDVDPFLRRRIAMVDAVDIIEVRLPSDRFGHSYYHRSPAASSDLLLLLRNGFEAGTRERPLLRLIPNYFLLEERDYPFVELPFEPILDEDD